MSIIKFLEQKILFIFLVFTVLSISSFSQQQNEIFSSIKKREINHGTVNITQPVDVEDLMNLYIISNKKKSGVEGYRIQINFFTGNNARQDAYNVRTKVMKDFPNETVSLEYDEPYWKVRIGYYRNKHEAIPLMRRLKGSYPNSFIVKVSNIKPENFE